MYSMRHSENFTGPRKSDTVTSTIATQHFTQYSLYDKFNLTQILKKILPNRTEVGFVTMWRFV